MQTKLNNLKKEIQINLPQRPLSSLRSEQDAQVEAELTLLLEDLITDHQVFQSFGYESLYKQGYLSYDLWKAFQSSNASLTIDRLNHAFETTRDGDDDMRMDQRDCNDFQNDVLDPYTISMQSPLSLSLAAGSGDLAQVQNLLADGCDPNALCPNTLDPKRFETVPLVEAIKHNHQEIVDLLISYGAKVDGPDHDRLLSPLIAALEVGNTHAISKLLSHRVDLKILGQLQDEDCWPFATNLIMNYGISIDSVLRVLPRSQAKEKMLRCALFDAGADIKSSTDHLGASHKFRFAGRPTTSGDHLDKSNGILTGNHPMPNTGTEVSQGSIEFPRLASHVSENLQTSIDNDQTKAPPLTNNERDMVRAIQRKDMESVDLHIKVGADPTLGLTAALIIRDPRIFKLLLERGADTDCIILSKARTSLIAAIEAGNQNFVDLLLKAPRATDSLGNVDFIHNGWTPLMIAVQHNNRRIARSLIRNGARPQFATCNGDSFTIARQNDFHDVLQILLKGTRVSLPIPKPGVRRDEVSSQALRSINWKEEDMWGEQ